MKKINLSNKAKKRILIGVGCFVFTLIVALSVPKNIYEDLLLKDDVLQEENVTNNKMTKLVYVCKKDDGLVGLNLSVDEEEKDEIKQKWDLLTCKSNTFPQGYYTPVETSTILEKYELLQNKLTLVLSNDFLNSDGKKALASIAWTFCNDDIDEVIIKVDNKVLNQLQDYCFSKIDRTINVNYYYETSYLFEADYFTIIHNEGEYLRPVTYFYENMTSVDFMASKLLSDSIVDNGYSYELNEKELTINLGTDDVLSTSILNEIIETVKLNFDVESFTVNNNVMTIYEEEFNIDKTSGAVNDDLKVDGIV